MQYQQQARSDFTDLILTFCIMTDAAIGRFKSSPKSAGSGVPKNLGRNSKGEPSEAKSPQPHLSSGNKIFIPLNPGCLNSGSPYWIIIPNI